MSLSRLVTQANALCQKRSKEVTEMVFTDLEK